MLFHFDDRVRSVGVEGAYSIVQGIDLKNCRRDLIEAYVSKAEKECLFKANKDYIDSDAVLAGFRELHTKVGMSNRKFISSPESLFLLLQRRGHIPRINPLVDIYNAVSISTSLALGAHDIDRIDGDVSLRITDGTERFTPLGSIQPEPVRPGEYGYIDSSNEIICRLEVRQVEKTKVTEGTKNYFIIVQGNSNTPRKMILDANELLLEQIKKFLGGDTETIYEPKNSQ